MSSHLCGWWSLPNMWRQREQWCQGQLILYIIMYFIHMPECHVMKFFSSFTFGACGHSWGCGGRESSGTGGTSGRVTPAGVRGGCWGFGRPLSWSCGSHGRFRREIIQFRHRGGVLRPKNYGWIEIPLCYWWQNISYTLLCYVSDK